MKSAPAEPGREGGEREYTYMRLYKPQQGANPILQGNAGGIPTLFLQVNGTMKEPLNCLHQIHRVSAW